MVLIVLGQFGVVFCYRSLFSCSCATNITSIRTPWAREGATEWKESKYEVFSGPYFPAFVLNTERCSYAGKYGPEKTPYLDTFHAVCGPNLKWIRVKVVTL